MPKNTESTTKFKADISELKAAMQEASRAVRLANSEFKAATAGMNDWAKSADGLSAKTKQLQSILNAQKSQLESLEKQYELVAKEQGENSKGAQDLTIKINNQKAAIASTEKSLAQYSQQLSDLVDEESKGETATSELTKTITDQQKELDELKKKYVDVVLEQGKGSQEANKLAGQISELSNDLANNKQKLSDAEKAADDFDESIGDAAKGAEEAANGGFTVLKGALANLASEAISNVLSGIKKIGTEIVNMGKQAYGAYASYEQLVGGVETLFGESADIIEEYAANAYKTAGMSANEYMETVTSFSASLIQSTGRGIQTNIEELKDGLDEAYKEQKRIYDDEYKEAQQYWKDTLALAKKNKDKNYDDLVKQRDEELTLLKRSNADKLEELKKANKEQIKVAEQANSASTTTSESLAKAAELSNQAIIDMSDNANKMGTSISSIQNAYAGFAKKNFTMLDNLKLGYGGTANEMLRLVKDAGVVDDSIESINDVSFDKIIEAIHIVQTNMGITGTTSKEASDTIEGSTKSMKAAWENLLVSIAADNGTFEKNLDAFTKSLETNLKNSVPRIKKIISGGWKAVKSLLRQYAPEVANTILPVLSKVTSAVKTAGTFIVKNFDKIAPAVMAAVAAFTAFNAAMMITKLITSVTAALGALEAGVGLATKAQTLWNAALNANPIGAVIAAVTALTAAVILLSDAFESDAKKAHEEEMAALDEQKEKIEANKEAYDDLKKSQQEQIDAGMTEMSYYEDLKSELDQIVDKNGKVKEGYEQRADFIISQLSEATGIEIEQIGGVIQKYDEVSKAIDNVMEKKKAQIILDSQESLYKEAINKQTEALRDLNTMQDQYETKRKEVDVLDQELTKASEDYLNSRNIAEASYNKMRMEELQKRIDAKNEELTTIESNYKTQEDLLKEYAYNIGQYEKNMQLAHEGNYDDMTNVTWNYIKDYESANDAQKKILEDSIAAEETNLKMLKELKGNSDTDIYDQQIKQAEKRLEEQKKELEKYNKTTEDKLKDTSIIWSDGLDTQLSELTGREVEFKDAGHNQVVMYVDGMKTGKSLSRETMSDLVTEAINEVSLEYTHAEEAGENLIDGVNKGIANESKQNSVFRTIENFGNNLLGKLKKSLEERSPSKATKEMGQYLLEGLSVGIDDEEGDLLKQISGVGEDALNVLNSELEEGIDADPLVNGFEEALKNFLERFDNLIPGLKISELIEKGLSRYSHGGLLTNAGTSIGQYRRSIGASARGVEYNPFGQNGNTSNNTTSNKTINFYQTNNSPKSLDTLTVYRETNSLLFSAGVKLNNV